MDESSHAIPEAGPATVFEFSVPLEHPVFPDHFPNDPLVPGALLLRWMVHLLAGQFRITGIRQCKFLQAVRPGDKLRWHVINVDKHLKIRCECADRVVLLAQCSYLLAPLHPEVTTVHD